MTSIKEIQLYEFKKKIENYKPIVKSEDLENKQSITNRETSKS